MPYTEFIDSLSVNKVSNFNYLYTIKSYQTQTLYSGQEKSTSRTTVTDYTAFIAWLHTPSSEDRKDDCVSLLSKHKQSV